MHFKNIYSKIYFIFHLLLSSYLINMPSRNKNITWKEFTDTNYLINRF